MVRARRLEGRLRQRIRETPKEAEAIEAARRATIRTQPSGRAKDLPELYVNRAMRWFLIFTTPINRFWNMLAWDVPRDIRNRRVGHALVTLAALFSIAAIEEIIRTWRVPDEPEEAKKFALRVTSRFADWTPIAGQQIGPALRGEWFADKGTNPLPFALSATRAVQELVDAESRAPQRIRATQRASGDLGRLFGVATPALVDMMESLYDEDLDQVQFDVWELLGGPRRTDVSPTHWSTLTGTGPLLSKQEYQDGDVAAASMSRR